VATGAVVARVPSPRLAVLTNVAAAPDDRTFYAAYAITRVNEHPANEHEEALYSFRVLGPGKVTRLTPIRGGEVAYAHFLAGIPALAVSPDGTKIAIALSTGTLTRGFTFLQHTTSEIAVIDLRTGARQVWQGGLNRTGFALTLRSLSWAGNGRSLDFLAAWCARGGPQGGVCSEYVVPAASTAQVRALSLRTIGGNLDASTVLLSEPRFVEWMVAPDNDHFDLLTLAPPKSVDLPPQGLTIGQYSADGRFQRVLYQHTYAGGRGGIRGSSFTADPSGRHLLIGLELARCPGSTCSNPTEIGWIDNGSFRPLQSSATGSDEIGW
jgi:hypothetical protein